MEFANYKDVPKMKLSAIKVSDNREILATEAMKKDGPFYCAETYEELIVRKCIEKCDHFAYKARVSPIAKKESKLHKRCKDELLTALIKAFPDGNWEKERKNLNENKEKGYQRVVPDLSGRIDGKGLIIEIQVSSLSVKKIQHRTEQYNKRGAFILWIVPLIEDLGADNFRPRLFERYLHTMYYGRVYYWYKNDGSILTPVHFGEADRWIEETSWFDENGMERTAGGYFQPFKRIKKPEYGLKVDLTKDFKFEKRDRFVLENDELSAPKSKIFMDKNSSWWDKEL